MSKGIKVRKGNETFEIADADLSAAMKDGYLPIDRVMVANSKTKESFEIDPKDLPNAMKDGFAFTGVKKNGISSPTPLNSDGLVPLNVSPEQVQEFEQNRSRFEAPKMQLSEQEIADDPVHSFKKATLSKVKQRIIPQSNVSSTAGQQPLELRSEQPEPVTESISFKEARKEIDKAENYFRNNTDVALNHLSKVTGLSPQELYLDENKEVVDAKLRAGNDTDRITAEALENAKTARKITGEGGDFTTQAIKLAASKSPEFAKQVENLSATELKEATLGQLEFDYFNDPIIEQEIKQNPQLYSEYKGQKFNLFNRRPEFGRRYYGSIIAQKMEDMGLNNGVLNVVTKEELDKVVDKLEEEGKLSLQDKSFIEREVRPRMGLRNFANAIIGDAIVPTTGAIENLAEGGVAGIKSLAIDLPSKLAADIRMGTGLSNKEAYLPDALERDAKKVGVKPSTLLHEMTQFGGNIMGQSLSLGSGGKFLQGIGAAKDLGTAVRMAGAMQAYAQYSDEALKKFGDNTLKQVAYKGIMAAMFYKTEGIFNDAKVVDGLMRKIKPDVVRVIKDFTSKNINEAAIANGLSGGLAKIFKKELPKAAKFAGRAIKENEIEELTQDISDQAITGVFEGKPIDEIIDAQRLYNTGRQALFGSPFIATLSAVSDMKRNKGMTARTVYEMAQNAEQWKAEMIEEAKLDSDLQAALPDKIANLDYAAKVLNDLEGTDMTEKAKIKYLITSLDNKVREAKAEGITDNTLKSKETEAIKANEAVQDALLNGKDDGSFEGEKTEDGDDVVELTAQEQAAIDGLKTGDFEGTGIKMYTNVLQDGEATDKQKRAALQGIHDQLTAKGTEIRVGEALGKKADLIYDLGYEKTEESPELKALLAGEEKGDWSKDVESTAKALEKLGYDVYYDKLYNHSNYIYENDFNGISTEYHEAKADGSNPKLVKAVEDLLGAQIQETKTIEQPAPTQEKPKVRVTADELEAAQHKQNEKETTQDANEATPTKSDPTEPIKDSKEAGEGQEMRLAHADTEQIYQEAGLPLRLETPTKHRAELEREADEILQRGYDFNRVAEETMTGNRKWEDTDQVLFARKVADLIAKQNRTDIQSPEFDRLQNEIEKLSRASDLAGTIGARFLESRKGYRRVEESLSDYVTIEKETTGVETLTEGQKATVQKEFNDIQKAKDDFEAYMAKREAELAAKEAEVEFNKIKSTTKKSNKKHADFVAERKSLKEELAAAKKEHDDFLKEQGIHKAGFGSLTTKEAMIIGKIIRSYADEAATTLKDVVDKVLAEVKDVIPNIEDADIKDVIRGAYNEKKKTRNQLAARSFELKREVNLLNKLDELNKKPLSNKESDKIKRNKETKKLEDEIKALRGEEVVKLTKDEKKLETYKAKLAKEIDETNYKIKTGDYDGEAPKKTMKLDAEANELRDKLLKLQQARDVRLLLQQRQNESRREKALRLTAEVGNIPRTLMTIADFSGLLRQNIFFTVGHPVMTAKALPGMFKSFVSQKVYDRWFADLKDSPEYSTIEKSGLAISDSLNHDLSKREEDFMSSLAEKIPIIGRTVNVKGVKVPGLNIVKGSERSYTMLLNKMRVDVFNSLTKDLARRGQTFENSPKVYKAVAEYVNNATGRSDFGQTLNRVAPVLNSAFFSPRLIASRVNMLTYWAQPRFYTTLPKEARRDYFRNWLSLLGVGGTILAVAMLGGADVEEDPRSSDFGKIKDGNTRWDIWGGAQPYIRVLAQIVSGERKSTKSGKIYELSGDDIFGETRAGVTSDFFRNKLAPVPGAAVDLLSGRTGIGEKIVYQWGNAKDKEVAINHYIKERVLPMTITGTAEAMKDAGIKALFTVGIPNVFGVGTQTYGGSDNNSTPNRQSRERTRPNRERNER